MCYILYGAIDQPIEPKDHEFISPKYAYTLSTGTRHDVKMSIVNSSEQFRVTDWICDCEFPVGMQNETAEELIELAALITDLQTRVGAGTIYLSKSWAGKRTKKEKHIYVEDVDLISFLANMELNCIYRMELRK